MLKVNKQSKEEWKYWLSWIIKNSKEDKTNKLTKLNLSWNIMKRLKIIISKYWKYIKLIKN